VLLGAGSGQVLEALRREVNARGLGDEVQVTMCGSLGLCEHGPNLVVYPEGIWYSGVTPADVPEIVRSHFQEDAPVERLVRTDAAALRAEIVQNRDKMLAALRARDAAGVLPDELIDRIRGFQESRVVLTALNWTCSPRWEAAPRRRKRPWDLAPTRAPRRCC